MVSHMVFVADGRRLRVTHALEDPFATDPKNLRVRQTTTTDDRAARVADLLDPSRTPQDGGDGDAAMAARAKLEGSTR